MLEVKNLHATIAGKEAPKETKKERHKSSLKRVLDSY